MASPTDMVLSYATLAYKNKDHQSFAEAILLSPSEPGFQEVQRDLYDQVSPIPAPSPRSTQSSPCVQDTESIRPTVLAHFSGREDKTVVEFLTAMLVYVANFNELEQDHTSGEAARTHFEDLASAYGYVLL